MKRSFVAVFAWLALCMFGAEALNASIPRSKPEQNLQPPETVLSRAKDGLRFTPYIAGVLTYRGEQLEWFAVVEMVTETVGVVIVTDGRRDFRDHAGPDVPFVIEILSENGKVVSYLVFLATVCEASALQKDACAFTEFANDITAKVQHIPEFEKVCVISYVGMQQAQSLPCVSP